MGEEDPLPVDRLLHGWLAGSVPPARARVGVIEAKGREAEGRWEVAEEN